MFDCSPGSRELSAYCLLRFLLQLYPSSPRLCAAFTAHMPGTDIEDASNFRRMTHFMSRFKRLVSSVVPRQVLKHFRRRSRVYSQKWWRTGGYGISPNQIGSSLLKLSGRCVATDIVHSFPCSRHHVASQSSTIKHMQHKCFVNNTQS